MRVYRFLYTGMLAGALSPLALAQSYLTTTFAGSSRLLDGHTANTVPGGTWQCSSSYGFF